MDFTQSTAFSYFASRQDPRFRVVTDGEGLEHMMNALRPAKSVAVDYETNGLRWWRGNNPCGVAFTTQAASDPQPLNWYVPFRHITGQTQLAPELVIAAQKEILENPQIEKIGHNIKFEQHMARGDGMRILGPRVDTMIEARLFAEDQPAGLKERMVTDLGDPDGKLHEDMLKTDTHRLAKWHGFGVKEYMERFGYAELEIYLCGMYAAHDTFGTWNLHQFYEKQGIRSYYSKSPRGPGFRGIYDIEMRLTDVLAKMEHVGQPIDIDYLRHLHAHLEKERDIAQGAFFKEMYGKTEYFNLGSDDQLREFLVKGLHLKWDQYTDSGNLSVDSDALSDLAKQVPALEFVLRFKEVEKKLSTYTLALIDRADAHGVLHCDFKQAGTNTGRLSCEKPNLQNISSDDPDRAKANKGLDPESIKRAFIVRRQSSDPFVKTLGEHIKLVRAFWDYSQIELRVLADYTKDERLVQAYLDDKDIHDEVERAVFNTGTTWVDGKKIDGPNRRKAKVINFGLCLDGLSLVLTKQDGYVFLQNVQPWHLLWDGVEWVHHEGLVCRGEQEVMTYDGLTATPEHEVFTDDGRRMPLCCLEHLGLRIASGEIEGFLQRYVTVFDREDWSPAVATRCGSCVLCLRKGGACESIADREGAGWLRLSGRPQEEQVQGSSCQGSRGALRFHETTLRTRYARLVQKLQGARDQSALRIQRVFCAVGAGEMAAYGFQGSGSGSQGQRWGLQSRESSARRSEDESQPPSQTWWRVLQSRARTVWRKFVPQEESGWDCETTRLPGVHEEVRSSFSGPKKTLVYDLLNAGPRHRFTVAGKIVSNSYCMSPIGFARQIKEVTEEEAQGYFDEYNKKFPGVPAFRNKFWSFIRLNRCQFDNKFGRTRHVPGIVSGDNAVKRRSERMSIATLIQGTAAELTKQSLVLLDEYITDNKLQTRISQTIHDEIQTDGPVQEFAQICRATHKIMTTYPDFCVPIRVDGKFSTTHWCDKKEIGLK